MSLNVWWPKLNTEIGNVVKICVACQGTRNRPPPVVFHSCLWPAEAWERIHIDYAGPFMDTMFLIVLDAYSKWL